ncbi:hypothetical protein MSG28_003751 [Choristoneura fumiferana]|uniref:Uncharacterized protein n=1 Tax=Choristoneura fumiferana TaxID=7141 RepID=A0ACC0KG94_CHOFU|nr:hypothetical protein MSG28_003751 [Choristoneura fumiferana]
MYLRRARRRIRDLSPPFEIQLVATEYEAGSPTRQTTATKSILRASVSHGSSISGPSHAAIRTMCFVVYQRGRAAPPARAALAPLTANNSVRRYSDKIVFNEKRKCSEP